MQNNTKINGFNERLQQALSSVSEKGDNPAGILQKILNIGKDAAYRRLRGEVPFTVDELSVVCNELGICMDTIIYGIETGKAIFDLEENISGQEGHDAFLRKLETHTKIWESEGNKLTAACPVLPEFIMLRFPKFAKFRLFANYTDLNNPYSEFVVPKQFKDIQLAYNMAFAGINSIELILDDNLLTPFIKEIGYFGKLGILSSEEVSDLNKELLLITEVLENTALSGFLSGTKTPVDVYLSHTNIGTETWLLENSTKNCTAWLSPYPGKNIRTQNKKVCQNHKMRIDEIKRFSTFITKSGEIVRRDYFSKLRNYIKEHDII